MWQKFNWREAVSYGWEEMKKNIVFFIILLACVLVVYLIPEIPRALTEKKLPLVSLFFSIISTIVSMVIGMGMIRIALKLYDNQKPELKDLIPEWPLFLMYILMSLLYGIIVIVGLILLIVPGIIAGIALQFCTYLVIDKNMDPIEALKKSYAMTKGIKWDLFVFGLIILGINILGALCLLVGLFVTIPVTMMAIVFIYRRLVSGGEERNTVTSVAGK